MGIPQWYPSTGSLNGWWEVCSVIAAWEEDVRENLRRAVGVPSLDEDVEVVGCEKEGRIFDSEADDGEVHVVLEDVLRRVGRVGRGVRHGAEGTCEVWS